jgi:hypothetical protein
MGKHSHPESISLRSFPGKREINHLYQVQHKGSQQLLKQLLASGFQESRLEELFVFLSKHYKACAHI